MGMEKCDYGYGSSDGYAGGQEGYGMGASEIAVEKSKKSDGQPIISL